MLPDGSGDFTRRMGMLIRKDHLGFGQRSWRYLMVVDDGKIVAWFEEPGINDTGADEDPYGESSPEKALEWLQANPRGSAAGENAGSAATRAA
jgi:thioredoxin-dependent peroxiredoxin